MHTATISYYAENISFRLKNKKIISDWIKKVILFEKRELQSVSFVFCNDEYLLKLNQIYLKHQTLTDIITFDYNEDNNIAGDIFISIERVKENAIIFGNTFSDELHRVMIHGIIHLLGYKDKKSSERLAMRAKEDVCLSMLGKVVSRET
jgi:rRNA maturation RNase YbeY